jgi:hypothetical protein
MIKQAYCFVRSLIRNTQVRNTMTVQQLPTNIVRGEGIWQSSLDTVQTVPYKWLAPSGDLIAALMIHDVFHRESAAFQHNTHTAY